MPEIREQELRGMVAPNDQIAEISVLGAMLKDANFVLRAVESLRPEDFYLAEHQEIYRAMAELARNHKPVDLTTTAGELIRRGTFKGVGESAYLIRLNDSVPSTANALTYLETVREKSTLG